MAFPLTTVLSAAPGLISAATDIIRVIKERKQKQNGEPQQTEEERIDELESVIEQQARVIEELALNNRNLTLAVRNNRILCFSSLFTALIALILVIVVVLQAVV